MRVLIVDDEELARRGIRARLERCKNVSVVGECANGREAIECIRKNSPDLVFLDVQMPGKNGFDVIEAIGAKRFPQVVFVTAHDRFAIRAFEVNALDYLLKPIDDERFNVAIERARKSLAREKDSDLARRLTAVIGVVRPDPQTESARLNDRIVVRSGGRVAFVKIAEIDWIEAAGDYVTLHVGKKTWLLRETISAIDDKLAAKGFARIHRSTVVNLERISEVRTLDNGESLALLIDGTQLKLSRSYRASVQQLLEGTG